VSSIRGVALMAAVILTGCSDPGPDVMALPDDIATVVHPLESYQLDRDQSQLTQRARYLLTRRCVRRYKLDLPPMDTAPRREKRRDDYGLADARDARRWGYTLDWDRPSELPWEARIEPDSRLFVVVNGRTTSGRPIPGLPTGGCQGEARRALAGPTKDPVPDLIRRAWSTSRESPEVVSATRRWHTCIEKAGYRYDNPVESPFGYWSERRMRANPRPTAAQRRHGIPPTAEEIEAAVADVACKQESGFLSAWVASNIEHQRRLVTEHQHDLTEHRRRLDATVARARRVLAGQSL
jgi:hypothetical protein